MSWSYDPSLPTDKDKVRALIGDTNTDNQRVTDELIILLLEQAGGNIFRAASLAASSISTFYSSKSSVTIGPMSVDFGNQASAFSDLAARLLGMADEVGTLAEVVPYVGGLSDARAEEFSRYADSDFRDPAFKRGIHDNHESAPETDWGVTSG